MERRVSAVNLSAALAESARCESCSFLGRDSGCELRHLAISSPGASVCANHPDHDPTGKRVPVGPVFLVMEEDLHPIAEPPDEEKVRRTLIDSLAHIDATSPQELSFRDRVVVWQARRSGDRRAFVHLDKLEATLLGTPSRLANPAGALHSVEALHAVATRAGLVDERGRFDPAKMSVPGRLLLLSALVVLGVGWWAEIQLWDWLQEDSPSAWIPLFPLASALIAVLYVMLGLMVFRRLRIPFRAVDRSERAQS